ncbi:MAG: transposase [Planctomycetes bacterium]|nr:transposase [Planctomycetota bacterium]
MSCADRAPIPQPRPSHRCGGARHRGSQQAAEDHLRQRGRVHERPLRRAGLPARCRAGLHPARPQDVGGFIEFFNGRLRDERLNTNWFEDPPDADRVIQAWVLGNNESRPGARVDQLPPATYVAGGSCRWLFAKVREFSPRMHARRGRRHACGHSHGLQRRCRRRSLACGGRSSHPT